MVIPQVILWIVDIEEYISIFFCKWLIDASVFTAFHTKIFFK